MRSRHWATLTTAFVAAVCTTSHNPPNVGSLGPGEWHAIVVNGRPAIPADVSKRPSIQFAADSNHASGSTGCNRFAGPYTVSGSSLTFGALAVTRMACIDSAVNVQETAFTDALGAIGRFAIAGDTLTLYSGDSARLRFVR